MRKNIFISLSLFIIFIGSCFLVSGQANTSSFSQTGTNQINDLNNAHPQSTDTVSNLNSLNTGTSGNLTIYNINDPGIVIGDQAVSDIWSQAPKVQVQAFSGNNPDGYVQFLHDSKYVYALFAYDTQAVTWVGVEFNATTSSPMADGHDGWIFGSSSKANTYYGDVYFIGEVAPVPDVQQDVSFEKIVDSATGLTYIEIMRAMNTNDTAGHDVVFTPSLSLNVRFASSKLHKTLNPNDLFSLDFTATSLPIQTQKTTTTTSTTPLAVLQAQHLQDILIWGSVGFFFNIILINLLIIYHRRST